MTPFERPSYKRIRMRGFGCSDKLWNRILNVTKDANSVSTFIRQALEKELEEWEHGRRE